MEATLPKQVGIWIRVSTEDQVQGESPEHHEFRARSYAEMKGWEVKKVYRLDAVSGKSVKDQPQTKEMLEDVKMGRISGLIFSKLARLARNTRELLEFADIFRDFGADLISLQESIDTSSPAGRLFYTMIAAMAQWEREEIGARIKASIPVRAQMGKSLGGQAPFGYKWEGGQLELDPEEAPIRKKMFELYLEHKRKKTVARLLNEAGYRTRGGKKFGYTSVDRLLRDPIAKGKRRSNYSTKVGATNKHARKPESEWIWNTVPAIVSEELWDQVNAILDEQRSKRKKPGRKPRHLFSGLLYCQCGKKMYVHDGSPKYVCKACRNKIPQEDLENLFYAKFKQFWSSPVDVNDYLSRANDVVHDRSQELEVLEKELDSVNAEMDKIYQLYVSDKITADGFGRVYGPLEERRKQLEDEIPRVQGEVDFLKIQYLTGDEIKHNAVNIYSMWPQWEFKEKRQMVDALVHRIEVQDDTVLIDLAMPTHLPSSFDEEKAGKRHQTHIACGRL